MDYPYLLQLLAYLDENPNCREEMVKTSCPPGTEELLDCLLARGSEKLRLCLSVLPSTYPRLKDGALEMVACDFRRRLSLPRGEYGGR